MLHKISYTVQDIVIRYSRLLWKYQEGEQYPEMVNWIPQELKEQIFWSSYQHHFLQVRFRRMCRK